ncbi:unnamed protein product [Rhizoctonia solani]|uniref:Uncharacterized protein n=1 Tax=Rhizoctonia solani TaxID=456999 RepID=A0A8H3AQJ6_9AGAM|nr:unnamed protein product [Rhizoctonia solani]
MICKGGPFSGSGADAERLRAFQESVGDLDIKLQRFANAIRWLGSSVGLLDATVHIQERLPQILDLFQDNASRLFDTGVAPYTPDVKVNPFKRYRRRSSLLSELESLADALRMFVNRLEDVPEFIDEAVHTTHKLVFKAFQAFADDLSYHADCLSDFKDKISNIASVRHIHELTDDLSSQADHISRALDGFVQGGVPAIRYLQECMADRLQNLSTTATFFSAVSATTIQFSYQLRGGVLDNLLNVLWISSLVFSIASALNSQLAYHWREVMYRSPGCYVPWWISIWITYTPLLFLVVSVVAFLFGLCVFTYSTEQPSVVIIVVTSFTVLTSIALLCVGIWFASERWTYLSTQGSHWLVNILDERMSLAKKLGSSMLAKAYEFTGRAFDHLRSRANAVFSAAAARRNRPSTRSTHDEAGTEMDEEAQHSKAQNDANPIDLPTATVSRDDFDQGGYRRSGISWGQKSSSWSPGKDSEDQAQIPGQESILPDIQCSDIVVELLSRPGGLDLVGPRASTLRASQPMNRFSKQIMKIKEALLQRQVTPVRIKLVVPKLRTLCSAQLLSEHIAQVRHLRFSPNGQYLATCSWDRVTCIWKVGDGVSAAGKCEVMRQLVHTGNSEVVDIGQVSWSPTGENLLTKHRESIRIWNPLKFITSIPKKWKGDQMPLMHDVRGIILGETSNLALVSYKGNTPPQTWYIDKIPGITIQEGGHKCQIKLLQTYYPKNPVEFVGTSQFGAYKDTLVLAASKGLWLVINHWGNIHLGTVLRELDSYPYHAIKSRAYRARLES